MISVGRLKLAFLTKYWSLVVPIKAKLLGVSIGTKAAFYGAPIISMSRDSNVVIGDRVAMASDSRFTALGVSRPCILRTLRPGAKIFIGDDTGMSGAVICAAVQVSIGKQCLIGADVMIFDNDFHPTASEGRRYSNSDVSVESAPVFIGDNVFIGTRSIVLKGVSVGRNSVVGAGSVVASNVPENVIVAGCPAKVVGHV